MTPVALVKESIRTARAARVYSVLFGIISFAVVTAVVVLIGQAESQQSNVLATFNRPEFRTLVVSDANDLGVIPWTLSDRVSGVSNVEASWVLGSAFDVVNAAVPDASRASAHMITGDWERLPIRKIDGRWPERPGEAVVDVASSELFGFDRSGGVIESIWGGQWAVVGTFEPLHPRAPVGALVPSTLSGTGRSLSVTMTELSYLDAAASSVVSLTDAAGPGQVSVDRADDAVELGAEVTGTVAEHGRSIILTAMAAAIVVLAFLSILMVHSRRQEFGRRRALGATRTAIIALVLLQGAVVVSLATGLGLLVGTLASWIRYDSVASVGFLLALGLASTLGTAVAQIPSAIAAGARDPVRVLRTP